VDIPEDYGNQSGFGMMFYVQANAADDMFYLDNVRLYDTSVPEGDGQSGVGEVVDEEGVDDGADQTDDSTGESDEEVAQGDQQSGNYADGKAGNEGTADSVSGNLLENGNQLVVEGRQSDSQGAGGLVLASVDSNPPGGQELESAGSGLPNTG